MPGRKRKSSSGFRAHPEKCETTTIKIMLGRAPLHARY
ncbi:hypothetical protein DK66_3126 [Brucella suis 1330]|nr:hypothetical protein DK66_3126 [Brucella suis 1330]